MENALSESRFEALADEMLARMTEHLADVESERLDADLESGVLTLSFDDGARYVINSHRAARQIWMAADASAWHFDWVDGQWLCSRTGANLLDIVEARVGRRLGQKVSLGH